MLSNQWDCLNILYSHNVLSKNVKLKKTVFLKSGACKFLYDFLSLGCRSFYKLYHSFDVSQHHASHSLKSFDHNNPKLLFCKNVGEQNTVFYNHVAFNFILYFLENLSNFIFHFLSCKFNSLRYIKKNFNFCSFLQNKNCRKCMIYEVLWWYYVSLNFYLS